MITPLPPMATPMARCPDCGAEHVSVAAAGQCRDAHRDHRVWSHPPTLSRIAHDREEHDHG